MEFAKKYFDQKMIMTVPKFKNKAYLLKNRKSLDL